jgi:hypothetical protein
MERIMQRTSSRKIGAVLLTASTTAHADRYGVDESMSSSETPFTDFVWGALIIGVIYLIWKKFFG